MTSGGRTRRILELAHRDPSFRESVIRLGALQDQMTYSSVGGFLQFAPHMLEVASRAGLLDGIDQTSMDEMVAWISDSANELAYMVSAHERIPPSRKYRKNVGHVFVSWTVKNPRDREAARGIKAALDWFNIDYFDYTEHQLDDEADVSKQITEQLKNAIANSRISVETVSTEVGRPWVRFERSIIEETESIHRVFICLEWEKARLVRMSDKHEARITRVDVSGGRSGSIPVEFMEQWKGQAADTGYYATADFFYKCYEVAEVIRARLTGRRKRHPIFSFVDAYRFNVYCQQARYAELHVSVAGR